VDFLSDLAITFSNLSPETKRLTVLIAGLAAAIGPLIISVGALNAAMAVIVANPITFTIIGITAAIVTLNQVASSANPIFNNVAKATNKMRDAYADLETQLENINNLKGKGNQLSKEEIKTAIVSINSTIKKTNAIISENIARRKNLIAQQEQMLQLALEATRQVGKQGEFIGVESSKVERIKKNIASLNSEISKLQRKAGESVDAVLDLQTQLDTINSGSFDNNVVTPIIDGTEKIKKATDELSEFKLAGVTYGDEELLNFLGAVPKVKSGFEAIARKAEEMAQRIKQEVQSINQTFERMAEDAVFTVADMFGQMLTSDKFTGKDFGRGLLEMVATFMQQLGGLMIAFGIQFDLFKKSIFSGNAPLAIAAGAAMVAAGAAIKGALNNGIDGGNQPLGNTYSGVAGGGGFRPEMQNIVMESTIKGREIVLVQRRENSYRR
jgi:hypothetical protein